MNRFRIIPLLFVVLYASCANHVDLKVPDSVDPGSSRSDVQIPGTQLFMTLPPQFIVDSIHSGLLLDTVAHLGVSSAAMTTKGDSGTRIDIGYLPLVNLTLYRDEDVKEDDSLSKPFTLDLKATGFAYYKKVANAYVYTLGGEPIQDNEAADVITVIPLPPNAKPNLYAYIKNIANNYQRTRNKQVRFVPGQISGILSGQDSSYEMICGMYVGGLKGEIYARVAGTNKNPVTMLAVILHDVDNRLKAIQNAAHTFEVKEAQ